MHLRLTVSLLLFLLITPQYLFAAEALSRFPLLPFQRQSIKVFDREGRYIGRILPEKRYWAPIERIPEFLKKALVAVEDSRFYEHSGIDVKGIARALVKDVVKRSFAEGGSTITQQLVKNRHLSGEKSLDRKLEEAKLAIEYEKIYSKQQILEMYFNEIYYGNGAWGIAQAAKIYFDKTPDELTEIECIALAGVPKNPGRYNPRGKPAEVNRRRAVVLKRMEDVGYINQKKRAALSKEKLVYTKQNNTPNLLKDIKSRLVKMFGEQNLETADIEVTSSIDLDLQKSAEKILSESVKKISSKLEGAFIAIDPLTGDILAESGSIDYQKDGFNRAFYALRQPGSSIKPFLYAAAIESGIPSSSVWDDEKVSYPSKNGTVWTPENYGGESHGSISLRKALAYSNNVISVKLLEAVGVDRFETTLTRFGITLKNRDLTAALGTSEITLHDLVRGYAAFASGGTYSDTRLIVRIYDKNHSGWIESSLNKSEALLPAASFITSNMLQDVLKYGTAKNLQSFSTKYNVAGKTGTTTDYQDAWFIGYTPQIAAGVWVGYDRKSSGAKHITGGQAAAPIWGKVIAKWLEKRQIVDFAKPPDIVTLPIESETGCLADDDSADVIQEHFMPGTESNAECDTDFSL